MSGPTPPAEGGNWFTRGGWWFFAHLLSLGVLAPVPFAQAAVTTRRLSHAVAAIAYAVAVIVSFALRATAEKDAAGKSTGTASEISTAILLAVLLGGTAHLVVVRHQVYGAGRRAPGRLPPSAPAAPDPAIDAALAARGRREEARQIVTSDPLLARELRIGRPDLPHTYDDGGLVDLNLAPGTALTRTLGLNPSLVARIVEARQGGGRFGAVDDVFVRVELPVETWDVIRDRGVVLSTG